jgi:hypothetical protein
VNHGCLFIEEEFALRRERGRGDNVVDKKYIAVRQSQYTPVARTENMKSVSKFGD